MNAPAHQTLRLPALFSDHAVLRANRTNPFWGWARPLAAVSVSFSGAIRETTADSLGRWRLELPRVPAGGPYVLTVESSGTSITLSDILAGEVWLCSGQSNMEWMLIDANHATAEIAAANYPNIRLFDVPHITSPTPEPDVTASWQPCSPETAPRFSAVGYFFGREIHQTQQIPVGLISSSWGGTVAEAWTEASFLENEPAFASFMDPFQKASASPIAQRLALQPEMAADWRKAERYQDPGNRAFFRGWADIDFDDADWRDFSAPGLWREPDQHHRGAVWFRKEVFVPADWAGRDLILSLGALHDFDTSYFNGFKVGGLGKETVDAWKTPRLYRIPATLVQPGRMNLIATRVFVEFDLGGFTGGAPLTLYPAGTPIESGLTLEGTWKYRAEYAFDASVPYLAQNLFNAQNLPSHLYNGMIAPLTPFGLSGAIWYQGESNATRAEQYRILFPRLIASWRAGFENPELPFFFVLLANYQARQTSPVEGGWAEIRESQLEALKLPNTGVASAIDVGDAVDIHPRDKQSVGSRLALVARALVYHEKCEHSGPRFSTANREENRIRLFFSHSGSGLATPRNEPLQGFAVRASAGGEWLWAHATIEGSAVVLQHQDLPSIQEVRYAWASNPIGNLCNIQGLPALPFRHQISYAAISSRR